MQATEEWPTIDPQWPTMAIGHTDSMAQRHEQAAVDGNGPTYVSPDRDSGSTPGHYLKRAKRAPWPPWIVNEDSSVQVRKLDRAICAVTGHRRVTEHRVWHVEPL